MPSPALLLPTDRIVTARFPSVNLALAYADATRAAYYQAASKTVKITIKQ